MLNFGLSKNDAEVYLYLSKRGPSSVKGIVEAKNIDKVRVYRSLKSLQLKGMVESSIGIPAVYTAVDFRKVVDYFIRVKKTEAASVETEREQLISTWESLKLRKNPPITQRIMVAAGTSKIFSRIFDMVNDASHEFIALTTPWGLIKAEKNNVIADIATKLLKTGVSTKLLIVVNSHNSDLFEKFLGSSKVFFDNTKYVKYEYNIPGFAISDQKEMTIFLTFNGYTDAMSKDDLGLWTNNKMIVNAFNAMFQELWQRGVNLDTKLGKIKPDKDIVNTGQAIQQP